MGWANFFPKAPRLRRTEISGETKGFDPRALQFPSQMPFITERSQSMLAVPFEKRMDVGVEGVGVGLRE